MQPAWDALRQSEIRKDAKRLGCDATRRGCAEAKPVRARIQAGAVPMQPAWDALRQRGRGRPSERRNTDATRMGCAEAKYDTKDKVRKHLTMQPAWDALRTGLFPELTSVRNPLRPQ